MFIYGCFTFLKQQPHLLLRKPHRIAVKAHINRNFFVFGFKNQYVLSFMFLSFFCLNRNFQDFKIFRINPFFNSANPLIL